jgi:hypothetical protein
MDNDIYNQMACKIIEQQESAIGPMAVQQAMEVPNMAVNWRTHKVTVLGDGPAAIDDLVRQYEQFFGRVSVEACKNAVAPLLAQLPANMQPKMLQ